MSFASASSSSSPDARWADASSSPYSSPQASTSTSSLWTASSASGSVDGRGRLSFDSSSDMDAPSQLASSSEEDNNDDEQSCLALLEQLERERARVAARVRTGTPKRRTQAGGRDVQKAQEDVFGGYSLQNSPVGASPVAGPSTYQRTRRPQVHNAPHGINPSSSLASMQSMSTIRLSPSSNSLQRSSGSRRLSFTRTDIAELDIDAILDAYSHEVPFEEPASRPPSRSRRAAPAPSTPSRKPLPRSKSTTTLRNIRHDIFPAPPVPAPPPVPTFADKMPPLTRTTTKDSTRSTKSTSSNNAYDELFPHRRIAPFPTMPRVKSSTSLRSMAKKSSGFDASQAPPMPPLPLPPTPCSSRVAGNRTFSSFARQSTCSTTSSSASSFMSSPPLPSSPHFQQQQYPFLRQSYQSSHYAPSFSSSSRASTTLSDGSSVRWSVATSSTAPSSAAYSDAGDNCSRRGSVFLASPVLGAPASPARRGSAPRFRLADEPTEEEEEEYDAQSDRLSSYPMSRRGTVESAVSAPSEDDDDRKDSGLISWEDFASELEALAPPPTSTIKPQQQQQHQTTVKTPFAPAAGRRRFDSAASSPFPAPAAAKRPSVDRPRTGSASALSGPVAASRTAMLRGKLSLATLRVR